MSHHRYPICPTSGKFRYGERKNIKFAMRRVDRDRSRARFLEVTCSRHEIRGYRCPDCRGWHLTSKPARPIRLVLVTKLTVPTAQAIRRVAAAGPTTGTAA